MAYTIVKSNGDILTTIADGTINTTSTSLGLPGRNYAGYGQQLDTNFVHLLENFADTTVPPNPIRGQLWYNTDNGTMYVCPQNGESNAQAWLALTSTSSGGTTSFGEVTVTGNVQSDNLTATNTVSANAASLNNVEIANIANIANANVTSAIIGTATTSAVTAGSSSTSGTITGVWTHTGSGIANGVNGTSLWVTGGNLVVSGSGGVGIRTDNYYYANGTPISFAGTYSNSNVAGYLPSYGGNILTQQTQASVLTTGAVSNPGQITGQWTLTGGSRLNATYADLAERFAADDSYEPGTVVQIGGAKEITKVQDELSDEVFGVVSNTAAYLMNNGAGDDQTHPAVALAGRVHVKVIGAVSKGQRLVSAGNGKARAANTGEANAFNTIGRSLENKTGDGEGYIEAIVMIR